MSGYGLVLGGGGAKGSYEIGVWKALKELQISISAVGGTSVGALNGAMMVQDDYNLAYRLWTSISIESIIRVEKEIATVRDNRKKGIDSLSIVKNAIASGGLDITPLKELLNEVIDEKKIRESPIDLGIVTFSLSDFKPLRLFKKDIPEGKMVDYLLASACLPSFKLQKIDKKKYIDGGVYDNLPVSLMLDKKLKNIIVVDVGGPGINRKVNTKSASVIYIKSNDDIVDGVLDFDSYKLEKNIELGYYDTLRAFGKLKGNKYYLFRTEEFEENKNKFIENLGVNDFKKMYSFLGIDLASKNVGNNKYIIDRIMRTIQQYTDGKLDGTSVFPAMAEITAEQLGIDKMKSYSLNDLVDDILKEYEKIRVSQGYNDYIQGLKRLFISRNQIEFDSEMRKTIIESKFILSYNPSIDDTDERLKRFRKFIAIAFPKVSISNMFIALLLSRKN